MPDLSDYLTTAEVAELKGVTPQAVRAALRRGAITGARIAGRQLVLRSSLDAWEPNDYPRPDKTGRGQSS